MSATGRRKLDDQARSQATAFVGESPPVYSNFLRTMQAEILADATTSEGGHIYLTCNETAQSEIPKLTGCVGE